MLSPSRPIAACVLLASLAAGRAATAQTAPSVALVLPTGRALRVTLTDSTTLHRVGQRVTGRVVEPVYAYDRVVLPEGALVEGTITKLQPPSKLARIRSMSSGDFSPHRTVELRFDTVIRDGERIPIQTLAKNAAPHAKRTVAPSTEKEEQDKTGLAARATAEAKSRATSVVATAKQKVTDSIAAVKEPGKLARARDAVKEWAINRLPYRPQVLRKGTTYDAELQTPLEFGSAEPRAVAPEGTLPAPDSILTARLMTTLDSRATPRGSPLEAVVAAPVFADDGRLILPEGTRITGEVTYAQPARHFHRNGQLRFLFERVDLPDQQTAPMLASLHAIDVDADQRIALDDEGGAAVQNSKARFVEPALALLALHGSFDHGEGGGFEGGGVTGVPRTTTASASGGNFGRGVGGLIGFGAIGFVLGQVSRPLGIAFSVAGAARSVYTTFLGKGQEVTFPADTPIQIQLAPGPLR